MPRNDLKMLVEVVVEHEVHSCTKKEYLLLLFVE